MDEYYNQDPAGTDPVSPEGNGQAPENGHPQGGNSFGPAQEQEPYHSPYDAYRFQTPPDFSVRETRPGTGTGSSGPSGNGGKKPGRKTGIVIAICAAVALLLAGVVAAGTMLLVRIANTDELPDPEAVESLLPDMDGEEEDGGKTPEKEEREIEEAEVQTDDLTIPEVVEHCMPSMVAITNTSISEYYDIFGRAEEREAVSAGSGIIVGETDTELLIATNNHVIADSAEITVTFVDEEAVSGTVKGADDQEDLAIVSVLLSDLKQSTKDEIRVVQIGDSDSCVVGEQVVAIGNALGYGQSVSAGIVSALNREVTVNGSVHRLIQTDASINPGNSGGALLNMRGELIGINEVKYVDATVEGVGYAIPMAAAEPILDRLGSRTAREKADPSEAAWVGITCTDMPSSYVSMGYPAGVYVVEVVEGGPADEAGLEKGDIITGIDGTSVSGKDAFLRELEYFSAGETVDLTISRLDRSGRNFISSRVSITFGNKAEAMTEGREQPEQREEGPEEENNDRSSFHFQLPGY